MKRFLLLGLVSLCAAGLCFAGGDQAAGGGRTVTISFWDGSWNEESFAKISRLFTEKYPDIKVAGDFNVDQGMFEKYMLGMQNGTASDVVSVQLDWVNTFGSAGLLEPLDKYIAADKVDTSIFVPGAVAASTINGSVYGLSFRNETYALFYNTDLLRAAGFNEAPRTWDDVLKIAEACNKGGVNGFGLCGNNFGNVSFQYITMLRSSGGAILSPDNTKSALDSQVAIQTAELYNNLARFAPASVMENDNVANRNLFASGRVAMFMSGIYDVPEIEKANPNLKFGSVMVPVQNNATRKTILGGWSLVIPNKGKNKDAAWKFVQFLTSPEVAVQYTNTFTGTAAPAAAFSRYPAEIVQPHVDALKFAAAMPPTPAVVGIRQTIFNNLQVMLSGKASPREAMIETSARVNELLAENR
jgi:ABC-type glycerol-3-phosphate transport system substrate-binding protein